MADDSIETTNTDNGTSGTDPKTEKTVPYERFQRVNEAKKQAEEAILSLVSELVEDIPEEFRGLVPPLPATEQIKWIRDAKKSGLFTSKVETSGPDSKRPGGKVPADFATLTPYEKLSMGYTVKR